MKKFIFICCMLLLTIEGYSQIGGKISLSANDISITQEDEYARLSFPESTLMGKIGYPELPYIIKSYVVPIRAQVSGVRINPQTRQKLSGEYNIYPTQPPIPSNIGYQTEPFQKNVEAYKSSSSFPVNIVEIINDGFEQGYHIVTVAIYPIEYIASRKEVYIHSIDYSIEYTVGQISNNNSTQQKQSQRSIGLAKSYISAIVENPTDIDVYSPNIITVNQTKNIESTSVGTKSTKSFEVLNEVIPEYVIITNNELKPSFQKLADWKTQKGVPAIIKTTEEISSSYSGSDLPEKIREYLKDIRLRWGNNLFILLGGDTKVIPARMRISPVYNRPIPIDLYYSSIDGTWDENSRYPVFTSTAQYIGRAPVETINETDIFVNKVLAYEKAEVADRTYYNNTLILDAFMTGSDRLSTHYQCGQKSMIDNMPDNIKDNTRYIYDNANCLGGTRYDYRSSCSCPGADLELNRQNVLNSLNSQGVFGLNNFHIVYSMDHGHPLVHGASSIDKGENLSNESAPDNTSSK